jgi:hypothetical protein
MQFILLIIFGTINAVIANNKGFNPFIWFFTAGFLGLIVLLFMPSAKAVLLENEELYEQRRKAGNAAGLIIIGLAVVLVIVMIVLINS